MTYEVAEIESTDQIVITLHEDRESDVCIRSVDLFVSAMKVRFSAPTTSRIETVFQDDIADLIRSICKGATLSKQIINVPDFCLRIRGLAIDGYTLLVHTLENGMRQFIVRLKRAVGNALALFRPSDEEGQGLSMFSAQLPGLTNEQGRADDLFDEMLSHLYLPLVNLNTYLRAVLDGNKGGSTDSLGSSVVQLKTKAEVMQFAFDRLISEMMLSKYADPEKVQNRHPALDYQPAQQSA